MKHGYMLEKTRHFVFLGPVKFIQYDFFPNSIHFTLLSVLHFSLEMNEIWLYDVVLSLPIHLVMNIKAGYISSYSEYNNIEHRWSNISSLFNFSRLYASRNSFPLCFPILLMYAFSISLWFSEFYWWIMLSLTINL